MMRLIASLLALLLCAPAAAQVVNGPIGIPSGGGTYPNGFTITGSLYYAKDPQYGNCTWSTAGGADVGPCINAAITAAAAAGGGEVVLPAGSFNLATQVINGTSGVHLRGAGVGYMRDSNTPSAFVGITKLIWTGSAGATMFVETPSGSRSLYSVDVWGIVFDCASLANIGADFVAVNTSFINIGGAECRSINIRFTTLPSAFTDGPGTQDNDIWVQSRSTSASFSPTGILFDGAATSSFDSSVNRIHLAMAWVGKGDGIVFGYSDHNYIETAITYYDPTNQGGTALVFANSMYVMKNGIAVNGASNENRLYQNEAVVDVQGLWAGSTITQGTHTGSESITTIPITLTGTTNNLSQTLTAAAFTNVLVGMTASCTPNAACGIIAGNPVTAVGATTATLGSQTNGVANGTVVTFSYGITQYAVPGTYTLTFTGATTANLTAPAGGHSQSGITLTSGALSFTDMVLPFTGTPANNDTYTIVVPIGAKNTQVLNTDKGNSVPNPTIEPSQTSTPTFVSTSSNPFTSNFQQVTYTPSSPVLVGALPGTAAEVRFILTGQGGCGGAGIGIAAAGSGSGGGGGGGAGVFDTGWMPASLVSGNYTIAFAAQCTGPASGVSGSAGGNTTLAMTGLGGQGSNTITAFGGGGGAVGASGAATGGGGGGGTVGAGTSTTNGTGGAAGNFGATAGGSGGGGTNNSAPFPAGGSGGGGTSAVGVVGNGGFSEYGGTTGGGSGGGSNAGTASAGGNGYAPLYLNHVNGGAATGVAGAAGISAATNGAGIGFGGGGGAGGGGNTGTSTVGGAGGAGGTPGGGGGGGGSPTGNTTTGGAGGVGGTPQVIVMTR